MQTRRSRRSRTPKVNVFEAGVTVRFEGALVLEGLEAEFAGQQRVSGERLVRGCVEAFLSLGKNYAMRQTKVTCKDNKT